MVPRKCSQRHFYDGDISDMNGFFFPPVIDNHKEMALAVWVAIEINRKG